MRTGQRALLWLAAWLLVGLCSVVLLVAGLLGHPYAWVLLALLLVGSVAAALFRLHRLGGQLIDRLTPTPEPQDETAQRVYALQAAVRGHHLAPPLRLKVQATVQATQDALRITQGGMLTRAAFEARSAAERDIPDALAAYTRLCESGGSVSYAEVTLGEQLGLIEGRMAQIVQQEREAQARELEAGRQYLQDKYQP